MAYKTYHSKNIGPQPSEAACDGNEQVIEHTNNAPQTDITGWAERQAQLRSMADEASKKAYLPPREST
jgi:hypothetical protein